MNELKTIKTDELKRELERRGCDVTSVAPAKKKWSVGFVKKVWQYFDDIEADTFEMAVGVARSRLTDIDWTDYGNSPMVESCEEVSEQ